jgi:hypothetical protein
VVNVEFESPKFLVDIVHGTRDVYISTLAGVNLIIFAIGLGTKRNQLNSDHGINEARAQLNMEFTYPLQITNEAIIIDRKLIDVILHVCKLIMEESILSTQNIPGTGIKHIPLHISNRVRFRVQTPYQTH